jgi:hypothetical protein
MKTKLSKISGLLAWPRNDDGKGESSTPSQVGGPPPQRSLRQTLWLSIAIHIGFGLAAQAQGQNILCDPQFELDIPDGSFPSYGCWKPSWLCTGGSGTTTTAGRTGSGLWAYVGQEPTCWFTASYQEFSITQGYGYRGAAFLRSPPGQPWTAGSMAVVRVEFRNASGALLSTYDSSQLATSNTDWQEYVVTTPLPRTDAVYVRLVLYLQKPAVTGQTIVNFDDTSLTLIPVPPVVVAVSPSPNSQNVNPIAPITLRFNLPMSANSVNHNSFAVFPTQSQHATDDLAFHGLGNEITLTNSRPFKPGESVWATATTGLLSAGGLASANPFVWSFRERSSAGAGLFTAQSQIFGGGARRIAVGDFNADGHLDIVAGAGTNVIWIGDGHGNFLPTTQSFGAATTWVVAVGDFNGDGYPDLLLHAAGQLQVWLNSADRTGHFVDSGIRVGSGAGLMRKAVVADFNGDGKLDVFLCNETAPDEVWFGTGTGGFLDSRQRLGGASNRTYGADVGDINGDGAADVVVADWDDGTGNPYPLHVYLNNGTGFFYEVGTGFGDNSFGGARAVALADFDGDGILDLFVAHYSQFESYFGDGHGNFVLSQRFSSASFPQDLAVLDCDANGTLDVAVASYSSPQSVNELFLNTNGQFRNSGRPMYPSQHFGVVAADFDENGSVDLAFAGPYDNKVWLNPVQPKLNIQWTNNAAIISWRTEYQGFELYQASGLAGPWTLVGAPPTQIGNLNQVTLAVSSSRQFFRLQK